MVTALKPLKWLQRLKASSLFYSAIIATLLASMTKGVELLNGAKVFQEPNLVGAQSTDLTLMFVSPVMILDGGTITVTVPVDTSLQVSDTVPCQLQSIQSKAWQCESNGSQISFPLPTIYPDSTNQLIFRGVFFAPLSTDPTSPFKLRITDSNGALVATDNNDFILADLVANELQVASASQVDSIVVSEATPFYFTVTSKNPIPESGGVQLRFPKWNTKAANKVQGSFLLGIDEADNASTVDTTDPIAPTEDTIIETDQAIDLSRLCSPKSGVSSAIKCSVYSTSTFDYITVTDMFVGIRDAGDTFSFYVAGLRNPISQSAVNVRVLTFTSVLEVTDEGEHLFMGEIDRRDAALQAQQSFPIEPEDCAIETSDSTVQEFAIFFIAFKVAIPIEQGCIVTIQLPEDFKLSAGDVSRVQGWGIFGQTTDLNVGIDETQRTIEIIDQCVKYSGPNTPTNIKISVIKNPAVVKTTSSFLIEVRDENQKGIAIIDQYLTFTPTPGEVVDLSLTSLGGTQIEEVVDIQLDFTPKHSIMGNSYILLDLPAQLEFSCSLAKTEGLKTVPNCEKVGLNLLKFFNPFNDDVYDGNKPLSLVFRNRKLPGSNMMIRGITIKTFVMIDDADYLVDSFVDFLFDFFAPDQQLFLASEVRSGSDEVYSMTQFTLAHTLSNFVPSDAIINVSIPPQVEVGDLALVVSSCKGQKNLLESLKCELTAMDDGWHLLRVTDAFPIRGLQRLKDFELTIDSGLYTPLSMKTSESFHVIITDSLGHEINYVKTALSLTMKQGKDIGPNFVEVSSGVVGDYASHKVSFFSPTPLYEDFLIIVNIPDQFRPPMEQYFECQTTYPLSAANFGCRINGQRITVTVAIDEFYPDSRISIGDEISLEFSLIQNPGSTAPADPYEIEVKTFYYQIVAEQRTTGTILANTVPAAITAFDFDPLDKRQLATTTITLTWINTQVYPQDLTLLIEYDPSEIYPILEEGETTVPCIFSRTVFVTCEYLPDQPGLLKVSDILMIKQNPGLQLSLTLTSQFIDIVDPRKTNSWRITTYTDQSTSYMIDTIQTGLSFEFNCNVPCLTCLPDDPDYCTECNFFDEYLILYDGKCSADCPKGTYKEAFQCIPCDDKCKTCAEKSGSTCTSCYGGYEVQFPFLYGNTCVDECVFGFYGNRFDADCQECVSPCETCSELATNCTSCIMPLPGEPITKFLHDYECKAACPDGWVADEPSRSNVCELCSENCETCFRTREQCATCKPGFKLNTLDLTCVKECPAGITVVSMQGGIEICEPCDSKCVTCSGRADYCTSCQSNLNINEESGECKLECDESNLTAVSKNGQCVGCSASCETCQLTQDNCLSCRPGTFFYANSCVEKCPTKDGYQYQPTSDGICIIPGIICPFGYELTPSGNGCALKAQICIEPNTLNYDKTSCVPGSDDWIPFPMLAFCFLITLVVAGAKCKSRESRFVANLIVFLSFVEFIGMFVVLYFAYKFGIAPLVYLMVTAIMFNIAINVFFLVVFQKQIMNDLTFRHWATYNKATVRTISFLGFIFSFKVYRLLYSKFFGAKRFEAPWDDPYKFYTPLNLASLINLILVKLICMVACIFGIYYITWGYQLLIECFEFLIIQGIMLFLSVTEYCQMRSNLMKRKERPWKDVDRNKVERLRVMGGFEDNLSEDDQDPDEYMTKEGKKLEQIRKEVKPKALKTIHTMEKVLASLLVKKQRLQGADMGDTVHEVELLREKQLMLRNRRRCMSFHLERPTVADAWDFNTSDEEEAERDVISDPEDSRTKEMLRNTLFATRIDALNRVYLMRGQFDNCYAEARDPLVWPLTNAPQETKKVQTNVMELLGVDDLVEDSVTERSGDEFDPNNQASYLVNGVIERLDSDNSGEGYGTNTQLVRRGSHPNAEEYSRASQRPPVSKKATKNKRKRLTRRRMAELPNFDVEEILGEFETDADGKSVILQTADGRLKDKYGRQVNRRGYLIDPSGNVVTRGNVFIFYKEEIDFDDEIPAPYCFQKLQRNSKFTVQNFTVHRRMRKRDKLAMQDEFIEREFLKLKMQAKKKEKTGALSQQYSEVGIQGLNPSEKVHFAIDSSKHFMENNSSGIALLQNNEKLGEFDLSNIVLSNNPGVYSDEDEGGFNAEQFIAQNSTKVHRKPPSSGKKSRKSSSKRQANDDFINEVIEPVKAKTKEELLGGGHGGSRQSSRSRSKSNEKSQSSQRKSRKYRKTLNEVSNGNLMDQDASLKDIMALPTAGGDQVESEANELRDLDFGDQKRKLNNSSSAQIKNTTTRPPAPAMLSGNRSRHSRQGSKQQSGNQSLYENEQRTQQEKKSQVVNDEAFIRKVQQFNEYLDQKKHSQRQSQAQALNSVQATANSIIIDDTFLNPDGSVRQFGLAHKNLTSVYGRVRSKFNKQIRRGGTSLMSRPTGGVGKNRLEDPHRLINGMTHAQRERMLQLEINNLIDGKQDDLSLTSIQRKLNQAGFWGSASHTLSTPNVRGEGQHERRRNHDGKLEELRGIYSDFRLDGPGQRLNNTQMSPRSHANLTFDAKNILRDDLKEAAYPIAGRRVDYELRKVSEQAKNAQAYLEMKQSVGEVARRGVGDLGHQKPPIQKSSHASAGGGGARSSPRDLLHGKYL